MAARVFVGLDYQVTEADILDKFEAWGTVREVYIPKDFRGRCKGYAFVEYESAQDCAKAIEGADRTSLYGRILRLEPATGRKVYPESGAPRERRFPRREEGGGSSYRRDDREGGSPFRRDDRQEFSTLRLARPFVPSMAAVQRPVVLPQINPILGRRMFGLAASVVLRRRVA